MKSLLLLLIPLHSFANTESITLLNKISSEKASLENIISVTPYKIEEHKVIKKYFEGIKEQSNLLQQNTKKLRRFNTYLAEQDLQLICDDIFLSKEKWNLLLNNCTKNRFFLCSEEVRAYEQIKDDFKKVLSLEIQNRLKEDPSCL